MSPDLPARRRPPVSKTFIGVIDRSDPAAFAVRNLPWHLDDLDQAKQAFVSYQMIESASGSFKHSAGRDCDETTPSGWISAACI
jgi:hypothetical protein